MACPQWAQVCSQPPLALQRIDRALGWRQSAQRERAQSLPIQTEVCFRVAGTRIRRLEPRANQQAARSAPGTWPEAEL